MSAGNRSTALLAALIVTACATPAAHPGERDELQLALARALQAEDRDLLTEQNMLPEIGEPTEPALVFLVKKGCIMLRKLPSAPGEAPRNDWRLGDGCGGECHLGRLTSPYLSGDGLTCRVARQRDIRIVSYTPPAADARGDVRTRVSYEARLVDVADWARDPEYLAIWKSYGLNLETFSARADMVKTPAGWAPYQ